jgi:hypothetical protein
METQTRARAQVTLNSNGFEIETEITVKGLRNGFKLEEIPIFCLRREEGKSTLRIAFDGFKMFTTILTSGITPLTHDTYNARARDTPKVVDKTRKFVERTKVDG